MWTYKATVDRVVDGDTVDLCVDMGLRMFARERFRILGVDAPEVETPEGKTAKAWLIGYLGVGQNVTIQTSKGDKYGRWLARITMPDGSDLTQAIIASGHGVPYDGGAKSPPK